MTADTLLSKFGRCADADNFIRVLIKKESGQVVEFARRQTLRQAVADVVGLRHWGVDARVEAPVGVEARR